MAVTANQLTKRQEACRLAIKVLEAIHIYAGTAVYVDAATGYGTDTSNSGANEFFGIAVAECDNSGGSSGDLSVECWRSGTFTLPGSTLTQADVGKKVFASDNYTFVVAPAATAVPIGAVTEVVSASLMRVEIEPRASSAGVAVALTSLTHTAPGTPDYAIQDLVNTSAYGFVTKDEGNTVLSVIKNLQARVSALELR